MGKYLPFAFRRFLVFAILFLPLFGLYSSICHASYAEEYYRGRVLEVETINPRDDFKEFVEQRAQVLITSGSLRGKQTEVHHFYVEGQPYAIHHLTQGMSIIIYTYSTDGEVMDSGKFYFFGPARDRGLIFLGGLFLVLLLLVGRKKGIKTIISLVISGIIIAKVMLPLLLAGYPPIQIAVFGAGIIILSILLIIGGFNYKSFASILGTFMGVLFAGTLAYIMGEVSQITGFGSEEAQLLVYSPLVIDVRGLLFAGIIIGSLGAVTDVAMSIASSAERIKMNNPQIKRRELYSHSLAVGQDIMGTMANTLILAYVGAAIPLLLVFMSYQSQWLRIINLDYMATEMIRGLAGSIGLIISVPVTAFFAAYFMGRKGVDGGDEEEIE